MYIPAKYLYNRFLLNHLREEKASPVDQIDSSLVANLNILRVVLFPQLYLHVVGVWLPEEFREYS